METVRKLEKELKRMRASAMGTSIARGTDSSAATSGKGGGGIDIVSS